VTIDEAVQRTGTVSRRAGRNLADVLANNYDDLEIEFAPLGIDILKRNRENRSHFNLNGLSSRAIKKYGEFLSRVNIQRENLKVSQADLALVVSPLAVSKLRSGNFRTPLLNEYLQASDFVRQSVAVALEEDANGSYDDYLREMKYFEELPDPKDLIGRIIKGLPYPDSDIPRIIQRCREEGIDLEKYIDPSLKSSVS